MSNHCKILISILGLLFFIAFKSNAQGYLHTDGKNIVNGNGENIILKGIGTGNWMLMEGYMMKTEGFAGTQHEINAKLIETIGTEKTKTFFDTWLANNFTRADVDSMKAWGFNSVRVAMHYKWFTLPIEEEPIPGNNTWLLKGFKMIDNLLSWCSENEMYLILDLHGAPGGQGSNADISDYDPSKPSLWESPENKAKTVALWGKLAERYSKEAWIGGYDLINETNWTFPEANNSQMKDLFVQITNTIRAVDQNHIIYIEGNSWANDFSGLTPPWDDNLVYSFHKYWSGTAQGDLDWVLSLRDSNNVPLWLGESGENSNTWYTDLISLCESNNIGWSWWPVKKNGINNVQFVELPKSYENLVKYWKGEISTRPSEEEAFQAVMQWAENQKIENCKIQYDVIDAMIRQPHTDTIIPYKQNKLTEPIFFSDYDLGKNGIAYFDNDVAHYGGTWTDWNTGWELRSDGVDIENCTDTGNTSNGYNVGWTEVGEWMQYSLKTDSSALYTLSIRHASGGSGSKFHIEVNGADVTGKLNLPTTGGWQKWGTATFENILVPAGKIRIKYVIDEGSSNLSYFNFSNPKSARTADFTALSSRTASDGDEIYVSLSKEITSNIEELEATDFKLLVDGTPINIISIDKASSSSTELILKHNSKLYSDNVVTVSYNGTSVKSGAQNLLAFTNLLVKNNLPITSAIPGKIQAEDFYFNNNFALENCTDIGGGKNTGYAATGKYLDYQVHVIKSGNYKLSYRVATEKSDAEVIFQVGDGTSFNSIDTIRFTATGGWQKWETQSTSVHLEEGYYFIRILVKQGEYNLNWFEFDFSTSVGEKVTVPEFKIYPNPAQNKIHVDIHHFSKAPCRIEIIDLNGKILKSQSVNNTELVTLNLEGLRKGIYILKVLTEKRISSKRFVITNE